MRLIRNQENKLKKLFNAYLYRFLIEDFQFKKLCCDCYFCLLSCSSNSKVWWCKNL